MPALVPPLGTLAATFASKNSTNVMRLEEAFGSAKKVPTQSMSQWISCVKSLVAQLRGVGVILEDTKVVLVENTTPRSMLYKRGPLRLRSR